MDVITKVEVQFKEVHNPPKVKEVKEEVKKEK